tara:strand:+ start:1146 stop:1328 length:183 start_codon:yes stop_codon:yes gene_type:complete
MTIQKVTNAKTSWEDASVVTSYTLEYADGTILSVPLDIANRHYQEIQEWVAEGNTIEEAT